MFHRFMIVCWILFGVFSLVGLVGGIGVWHYDGKIQELRADLGYSSNLFMDLPAETYSDIPEGFTLDEPKPKDWRGDPIVDEEEARNRNIQLAAIAELNRRYNNRSGAFEIAGYVGAALAAIILFWNIFCHTVHWIWMGRKVER